MRKKRPPIKPNRGYEWLGAVGIAAISHFLVVNMLVDGQFTYGEPDGTIITAGDHPLMYWAGVAFPIAVGAAMVTLLIRGELRYRDGLRMYRQHKLEDQGK